MNIDTFLEIPISVVHISRIKFNEKIHNIYTRHILTKSSTYQYTLHFIQPPST